MKIKTAYIEITNKCNLNCRTCYNRSGLNCETRELSKSQILNIMDTLKQYGIKRLIFSGGEPVLHSEFDDILDIIINNQDYTFSIVTNGTIYCEKLINVYNNYDNISLQVSLDGSSEAINSKTRGIGNFSKPIEFIKSLHNQKNELLIKTVISQDNYGDVESFYRLAVSLDAIPEYAFINPQGNGSDGWQSRCISPQMKLKVIRLVNKLNDEYTVKAMLPLCTTSCPLSNEDEPMSVCIKVNGSIHPCQLLYNNYFCMGNVLKLNDMEFENQRKRISALVKERESTIYNCDKCLLGETCKKGCMAYAYDLYNDALACDSECDFRKLQLLGFSLLGEYK